jgi:hypothetical protein
MAIKSQSSKTHRVIAAMKMTKPSSPAAGIRAAVLGGAIKSNTIKPKPSVNRIEDNSDTPASTSD